MKLPQNFDKLPIAERRKIIDELKRRYDELMAAKQQRIIEENTERTLTTYTN